VTDPGARARLRELVTQRLGLAPSAMPDARVDDALARLSGAGDTAAPLDALAALSYHQPLWQQVIDALAVGETNFFRQATWFTQLERHILTPLIERRLLAGPRRLRLWSAACATGEETYTLAILVKRLLRNLSGWDISIVGTDISAAFLAAARRARYRPRSLRELDAAARAEHFRQDESGRFELVPETRALASFRAYNLAGAERGGDDPRLVDVDLIICRNVLMYLAPDHQRAVARRLTQRLAPDGWLATAPAEAIAEWFRPLTTVNVPSAVFFRSRANA
jgi:chemotaxis protein methyltransferase CheR